MRLTCPTCAAVYELPDDQLPAGGSHVQCTACHTRWFARAQQSTVAPPSEDEIIARLETRASRPGSAAASQPARPAGGAAPIAFPVPPRPRPAPAPAAPVPVAPVVAEAQPPRAAETAQTPLRPRAPEAGSAPARPAPPTAAPEPARRRGGGIGFLLALALAAGAAAAYREAEAIAARVPAASPALDAYVGGVDSARVWIETRLGSARDRLTGA